ncbi:hypothetical protein EYF80_005518 [Liparis tanakae]|uniref:Uncharacterized protein n=1 Tax=Liparis tanakae TaxID=230148 RepID=A0A4Z2J2L8_9TELE|nr:hypothetical protein EYF80_005518 [Liparis tanakae]
MKRRRLLLSSLPFPLPPTRCPHGRINGAGESSPLASAAPSSGDGTSCHFDDRVNRQAQLII